MKSYVFNAIFVVWVCIVVQNGFCMESSQEVDSSGNLIIKNEIVQLTLNDAMALKFPTDMELFFGSGFFNSVLKINNIEFNKKCDLFKLFHLAGSDPFIKRFIEYDESSNKFKIRIVIKHVIKNRRLCYLNYEVERYQNGNRVGSVGVFPFKLEYINSKYDFNEIIIDGICKILG